MAYETMPDGTVVQVPDNITPEGLAKVRAQYTPTRKQRVAKGEPRQTTRPNDYTRKVNERVKSQRKLDSADVFAQSAMFGFGDEIAGALRGATVGAYEGFKKGDVLGGIKEEYKITRDATRQNLKNYENENPAGSLAATVGGALVNPVGTGARGVFAAGKALKGLNSTKAASVGSKLQRGAARIRSAGPIGTGVAAGVTQGGLQAAGASDNISELPSDIAKGALVGGTMGGAFGLGTYGARVGVQTLRDRRASEAGRKAYERVGSLISKGKDTNGKPLTPAKVRNDIVAGNNAGADQRVVDALPGLRMEAAHIGRNTNVPRSNDLQQFAEDRVASRAARFGDQAAKRAKDKGIDARDYRESIDNARSGQGAYDYRAGGVMDQPVSWNVPMTEFFAKAGPSTQKALKRAKEIMLDERRDPTEISILTNGKPGEVPTFRTLDYLKRGFNEIIESAIGAGNRSKAGRISNEFNALKDMLIDQNPEYGKILVSQRDAFQKLQASELGEKVFGKLNTQPRQALREIKALSPELQDSARIGIIDKLLNLDVKADPVAAMRNYTRNPAQRKVLEFAFGGKKEVESFSKWLDREFKASMSDKAISTSRNSITQALQVAREGALDGAGEVGFQGVKGAAFGGQVGFFANAFRALQNLKAGMTIDVQDEIARILMSKGEDLERGIAEAAKFAVQRNMRNKSVSQSVSKAVSAPFGQMAGST